MRKFVMLLGRICLSLIFVTSAVTKLFTWNETVAYMSGSLNKLILATHFPAILEPAVTFVTTYAVPILIIATIFEGVGGLFVLLGFKVRMGATLLILFMIPVSLVMHPFWIEAGSVKDLQMAMFMKNLAILGGLFILSAKGGDSES